MALHSNKSSSSISIRANQPISRNSENANPMRKSFSGNPFTKPSITANSRGFNPNTPANSPSDFPRRNSIGSQSVGSLRELEEKENSKDQNVKAARVRSPTVSKCTKNFMSPTISAASKISASPKKKILVERNEPVRTSFSLSDWKSSSLNSVNPPETVEVDDSKSNTTLDQKSISATHDSTPATSAPKASRKTVTFLDCDDLTSISQIDTEFLPKTDSEEPDCVNLDPSFKISPTSCPPILAPLDADPSMPPYDPKTNYLSPRPRFLHYRPNPRIERYLNMEEDGKRLEYSFVSGSFSDTDATEETQSDISVKESDELSSVEFVKEQEEAEVCVSEPSPITATVTALEENVKTAIKNSSKPHFLKRNKFTILLLIIWIACFSTLFTSSLVFDPNIYEGSSFLSNDPSELFDYAKEKYDGLVRNLRVWSTNSISYFYEAISNSRTAKNLGPLQYFNLTSSLNEGIIDLVFDQSHDALGLIHESVVEMRSSLEEEDNPNQPEDGFDEDSDCEEQEQQETDEEESHESFEEEVVDFEDLELAPLPKVVEAEVELTPPPPPVEAEDSEAAARVNFELVETHVDSSEHQSSIEMEVHLGIYVSKEATKGEESTVFESIKPDADASESLEVDESFRVNPPRTEEEVDLTHKIQVVIALLIVLPLIAGTVFVYARRAKKGTISNAAVIPQEKQHLLTKKKE